MTSALDTFAAALHAYAAGAYVQAASLARAAAEQDPGSAVFAAGAEYAARVARHGKSGVYVTGEAFAQFIRGGGNVGLYRAVSAALRDTYHETGSLRLLDIGVGDGLALLPALTPEVRALQLVEPSGAMLAGTRAALAARGVAAEAFEGTLQAFLRSIPPGATWDIAQATFSLQSLPPPERTAALADLRRHTGRLLVAEFDVPAACDTPLAPDCVRHVVERYAEGLAEYAGDEGAVAQGFLMPVMFGYFDPTAARTNYEQPIARWADDLRAAGFAHVTARLLFPYWWGPAYLLDAR